MNMGQRVHSSRGTSAFFIRIKSVIERRRSRVIEWIGCGAESRRKVLSSRLDFAIRRLENTFVNTAVNGTFFELRKAK